MFYDIKIGAMTRRLPLCPMAEGTKQKLIEVLRQQNLI